MPSCAATFGDCKGRGSVNASPRVGPGNFTPGPLTEPGLTVSSHTARATQGRFLPSVPSAQFLLFPVDRIGWDAGDLPPSLHGNYPVSSLLWGSPTLRLRIRTLALVVASTCGFSVSIGASGSRVPLHRLFGKLRPPLMPDAAPPVNRFRRSSSRSNLPPRF
jgi:hypothetical protein